MKRLTHETTDLYVSDDVLAQYGHTEDEDEAAFLHFGSVRDNPSAAQAFDGAYGEYIRIYGRKTGLSRIGVLNAHGSAARTDAWHYVDGDRRVPVQEWIDAHDGQYACLILYLCNTHHHTPRSTRSLLLCPDATVWGSQDMESFVFTLLHPTRGEIDNYTIDAELAWFRRQRNQKPPQTTSRP